MHDNGAPRPDAAVRVPDHVVYRVFAAETVVLNLETGKYHGLNTSAGRMLETIEATATLQQASEQLATHYDLPQDEMLRALQGFCADLSTRGLIEIEDSAPGA